MTTRSCSCFIALRILSDAYCLLPDTALIFFLILPHPLVSTVSYTLLQLSNYEPSRITYRHFVLTYPYVFLHSFYIYILCYLARLLSQRIVDWYAMRRKVNYQNVGHNRGPPSEAAYQQLLPYYPSWFAFDTHLISDYIQNFHLLPSCLFDFLHGQQQSFVPIPLIVYHGGTQVQSQSSLLKLSPVFLWRERSVAVCWRVEYIKHTHLYRSV